MKAVASCAYLGRARLFPIQDERPIRSDTRLSVAWGNGFSAELPITFHLRSRLKRWRCTLVLGGVR